MALEAEYRAEHTRVIAQDRWVIDGLGRRDSVAVRLARATDIVLIDLPLWVHFWLAAERQIEWVTGRLEHPPAGFKEMPPIKGLVFDLTPEPVRGGQSFFPQPEAVCCQ